MMLGRSGKVVRYEISTIATSLRERFCFVVSPIGEPDTPERRRADGNEIVRPALEPRNYRVERADHDKGPGIVTESIISKLIDSHLVVADLTGLNPNVMYELAVRHATGKPVIQLLERGHRLPFDIQAQNTIMFAGDLAGRLEAIRLIQAAESAADDLQLGNQCGQRTLRRARGQRRVSC